MKKHQDVQAIEAAGTPEEKFSIALSGRKGVSGASDILTHFSTVRLFESLRRDNQILKMGMTGQMLFQEPAKSELAQIKKEHGSLQAYYTKKIESCKVAVSDIVFRELSKLNPDLFSHLADSCENAKPVANDSTVPQDVIFRANRGRKMSASDEQVCASPIDVAVLTLSITHKNTWPDVPMTKADLAKYLTDLKLGALHPETLDAVIKRTGIKLKRGKSGPRAEKRHRQ